jgi:hypothetical protein
MCLDVLEDFLHPTPALVPIQPSSSYSHRTSASFAALVACQG